MILNPNEKTATLIRYQIVLMLEELATEVGTPVNIKFNEFFKIEKHYSRRCLDSLREK